MFRRRALQISLVPNTKTAIDPGGPEIRNIELAQIQEIGRDVIVNTAAATVTVYGAIRIIKTICNIAEKIVEANLR